MHQPCSARSWLLEDANLCCLATNRAKELLSPTQHGHGACCVVVQRPSAQLFSVLNCCWECCVLTFKVIPPVGTSTTSTNCNTRREPGSLPVSLCGLKELQPRGQHNHFKTSEILTRSWSIPAFSHLFRCQHSTQNCT